MSGIHVACVYILICIAVVRARSNDLYFRPKHQIQNDDFVGRHQGESLPNFINRVVNPNDPYLKKCGKTINMVAELMRSKLVPEKVAATIKGGSLGKGTAVRGMADADLLFPLGGIESVKDLKEKLPEILKMLQSSLDKSEYKIKGIRKTPFTIQFEIEVDGGLEDVDLLPIIDLKIKHPTKDSLNPVYAEMKNHADLRPYYGKCLAFLQVNVVKQVNEKVKKVIRLLKYWIKTKKHALKSYGAELVVIKAYEEMGSIQSISERDLVMKVFEMLSDLKSLKISWKTYYDPTKYDIPSAPYILDPAFPYHNLIKQKTDGIDGKYVFLERDAKKILNVLKNQMNTG